MFSTSAPAFVSAATPPHWAMDGAQIMRFCWIFWAVRMSACGEDGPAQAPACHGIGLGEAVDGNGIIREFQDGVLLAGIDQPVVDLVGDDGDGQLDLQAFRCSISRQTPVGFAGELMIRALVRPVHALLYLGRVELEPVRTPGADEAGFGTQDLGEVRVAGIVRVGHDDLVTCIYQAGNGHEQRRRRAGGDHDAGLIDLDAVGLLIVL